MPRTSVITNGRRILRSNWSFLDSVCPSCSHSASRTYSQRNKHSIRPASSLASSTAINAKAAVQSSAAELYDSLNALKSTAANYINLSRLQLALRSLEIRNEVIRVAVLGLDDKQSMLKLVGSLLSISRTASKEWEDILESEADHGRGLLIRYGEDITVSKTNTLLITLHLPAPLLKQHNIEILTSNLNLENMSLQSTLRSSTPLDSFRVPTLETPASASGRFSLVTYPVHRVVIYGEGLRGCVRLGALADDYSISEERSVRLVLNVPGEGWTKDSIPSLNVIDIDSLEKSSLESKDKGEIKSSDSHDNVSLDRIASLISWIKEGTESNAGPIKPATQDLIDTILSDTLDSVTRHEGERLQTMIEHSVNEETRQSLTMALDDWAERGHAELRDQLELAFTSCTWQKVEWWKLLWRVDDVGMIASDILQQNWLREAEKRIIWMSGRLEESGLLNLDESSNLVIPLQQKTSKSPGRGFISTPPAPTFSDLIPQTISEKIASSSQKEPWPVEIPLTRAELSTTTIPPLQQLAQKLLIQTLTISSTSTAFAGLLMYAYAPLTTVYEVGFVAALGIGVGLKRLQGKWETARSNWESTLREEGRKALSQTERSIRLILETGGRPAPDPEEIQEQSRARDAVKRVNEALRRLK